MAFMQQSKSICHRFDLLMQTNTMVKDELAQLCEKAKRHLMDESTLSDSEKLMQKVVNALRWAIHALSMENLDESDSDSSDIQPQFESDED